MMGGDDEKDEEQWDRVNQRRRTKAHGMGAQMDSAEYRRDYGKNGDEEQEEEQIEKEGGTTGGGR